MNQRGLRMTQNANFSLITHTKQLLLVTLCDTTVGIRVIFRTHERRTADGERTDRRGSRNSYLDVIAYFNPFQKYKAKRPSSRL